MNTPLKQSTKEKIIKNMAQLWAHLFNNNFVHRDSNIGNFMIDEKNHDLFLTDIDNIYYMPFLSKKLMELNFARFNASLLKTFAENNIKNSSLTTKERVLFLREFIRYYKKEINIKHLVFEVNKMTIRRLFKQNKGNLVTQDEHLYYFHQMMIKEGIDK